MQLLVLWRQCIEVALKHSQDVCTNNLCLIQSCVFAPLLMGNQTALNKRLRLRQSIALEIALALISLAVGVIPLTSNRMAIRC